MEGSARGVQDIVNGGDGNDTLYGDAQLLLDSAHGGNDILHGESGDDTVHGDAFDFVMILSTAVAVTIPSMATLTD